MNQNNTRIVVLFHSKILFLPIVGSLLYILQSALFEKNLIYFLYFSRRNNHFGEKMLNQISTHSDYVICRSEKLSPVLEKITPPILYNVNTNNIKRFKLQKLYTLMMCLVYSTYVSHRTFKQLKSFLPKDYPLIRIVAIITNNKQKSHQIKNSTLKIFVKRNALQKYIIKRLNPDLVLKA